MSDRDKDFSGRGAEDEGEAETRGVERLALRALASARLDRQARGAAKERLAGYNWREPVHEVIFNILVSLGASSPNVVREQLPARLALRGFPDAELDDLFSPLELSRDEREALFLRLRREI